MIKKRIKRSPKEIIKSSEKPKYESHYVKFSGEEMVELPLIKKGRFRATSNIKEVNEFSEKNKKSYSFIHTHPSKIIDLLFFGFLGHVVPSKPDIESFLENEKIKSMVIAQRDKKTGEVEGYLYARKPKVYNLTKEELKNKLNNFYAISRGGDIQNIMEDYNLKYKLLPAEGYRVSKSGRRFEPKEPKPNLESKLVPIITISLLASVFFSSSSLTGFTISNLTQQTSNIIGITLFIIGLITFFYYFRRKKQTK